MLSSCCQQACMCRRWAHRKTLCCAVDGHLCAYMPLSAASPVGISVQIHSLSMWAPGACAGPWQNVADDLVPELHANRARRGGALAGGGSAVGAAVLDGRVQALGTQHARRTLSLQRRPGAPSPAPRGTLSMPRRIVFLGACCAGAALMLMMDMSRSACRGRALSVC